MIAIAIIAMLLIGAGVIFSIQGGVERAEGAPIVVEHPEMIDSVQLSKEKKEKGKNKKIKNSSKGTKTKEKKTYRRRSPLDEPV